MGCAFSAVTTTPASQRPLIGSGPAEATSTRARPRPPGLRVPRTPVARAHAHGAARRVFGHQLRDGALEGGGAVVRPAAAAEAEVDHRGQPGASGGVDDEAHGGEHVLDLEEILFA